jgi:hypothetical protein
MGGVMKCECNQSYTTVRMHTTSDIVVCLVESKVFLQNC